MKRIKKSRVSTKVASASVLASFMFLTACGGGGGGEVQLVKNRTPAVK